MENASKALIIAAGVLIAILVIALIVFAFNNMSDSVQVELTAEEEKQLAEFNTEFASYDRVGLTGFDMVSLVNKVIDYNILNAYAEGYPRVDVKFTLNDNSAKLLNIKNPYSTEGISDRQFLNGKVDVIFHDMQELESKYTRNVLTKLASRYVDIKNSGKNRNQLMAEILGVEESELGPIKNLSNDDLRNYQAYIEFKREENFSCINAKYENGRIRLLEFKQTK